MSKPLAGLRILDLTHMLSGPYGAMILADLGAETIKVEPLQGEGTRKLLATDPNNSLEGQGAYFITLNRNKQSVALDLKSDQGLEVFYDLVRESDIVIENFSAGVAGKLRIDYDHLAKINPRLINCSISGFGSDGPNYQRPAFDQHKLDQRKHHVDHRHIQIGYPDRRQPLCRCEQPVNHPADFET